MLAATVTWQLYKLIQIVYTSRVILELFIEVLSHNKSLYNAAISGPNTVNTNPANFCKALMAIFDEPKGRTNWPSSQRNLNVNNEDLFGTQVERQLQDGTVCALCVSLCRFGLVSCIFPELQNCQCSTAVGHPLPGGWIHISVCPDLPEWLFLSTRFSRKNYINWNLSFSHLCQIRLNPQFNKHDLCHRPVPSWRLFCFVSFVTSICELPRRDVTGARRDIHGTWQAKKGQGSAAD